MFLKSRLAVADPDFKARKSILEGQLFTIPHSPFDHFMYAAASTKAIQGENAQTISDQDPLAAFYHDAKMERVRDDGVCTIALWTCIFN